MSMNVNVVAMTIATGIGIGLACLPYAVDEALSVIDKLKEDWPALMLLLSE